jgi:hypothetical protein
MLFWAVYFFFSLALYLNNFEKKATINHSSVASLKSLTKRIDSLLFVLIKNYKNTLFKDVVEYSNPTGYGVEV